MRRILNLIKILPKLFFVLRIHLFRKMMFKHGVAAGVEHYFFLKSLACSINTFIDIGANRGQFALVARHHFPQARIISIEPLAEPSNKFREVFNSDSLTTLHQVAIGPAQETAEIHVSKADDSSSLLPIGELQQGLYPGTGERETRSVDVKPLDAFVNEVDILKPAFLKIDVQGYELQVLKGCQSLLQCFAYVYVECSFVELYQGQAFADDVIRFLHQHGFVLSGLFNLDYDKKGLPVQGDFLFERNLIKNSKRKIN